MNPTLKSYHAKILKTAQTSYSRPERTVDTEADSLTSFKDDLKGMEESVDQTCNKYQYSRRWSDTNWAK